MRVIIERMRPLLITSIALGLLPVVAAQAQTAPDGTYAGKTNQAKGQVRFVVDGAQTRISKFVFEWRAYKCTKKVNRAAGKTTARGIVVTAGDFAKGGSRTRRLPATETFGGGSQVERYRITGSLLPGDQARGTIRMTVTVRNRRGTVLDTCTMSRKARWTARKLGVTDPV